MEPNRRIHRAWLRGDSELFQHVEKVCARTQGKCGCGHLTRTVSTRSCGSSSHASSERVRLAAMTSLSTASTHCERPQNRCWTLSQRLVKKSACAATLPLLPA